MKRSFPVLFFFIMLFSCLSAAAVKRHEDSKAIIVPCFSSYIFGRSTSPVITVSTVTGNISACAGSPSVSPAIQQFDVSGSDLTTAVTITAPAGFELSLTKGSGYANKQSLNPSAGVLNITTIYVRSATATTAGTIAGNVVISSSGVADQLVAVSGSIQALPTIDAIANQTVTGGTSTKAINFTGNNNYEAFTWTNNTPGIGLAASGAGNIASFKAVNNNTQAITATITVTPKIANLVYTANIGDTTISAINTATNEVVATIPVPNTPMGIAVSADGSTVYVAGSFGNAIFVINAAKAQIIATIPYIFPMYLCLSKDGKKLYVTSAGKNASLLSVYRTTDYSLITSISIGPGGNEMCMSPDGSLLYITNPVSPLNIVSLVNTITDNLITHIPVGGGAYGIAVSPDGSRVYVSNTVTHTVSVIDASTNKAITTITVGAVDLLSPVCVSADGNQIYVGDISNNSILVFDTHSYTLIKTIPAGLQPVDMKITPDGNYLYIADQYSNAVSVIRTSDNENIATVNVGAGPYTLSNIVANAGCEGIPQTFTITVDPSPLPLINASTVDGAISACAGTASLSPDIQQFTVSGINLSTAITATAPAGFELSLDKTSGYSNSLVLPENRGTVTNTVVYVRSASNAPVGKNSDKVILSSSGATSVDVTVSATVNAIATVNAVSNQNLTSGTATMPVNFTGTADTFSWTNDTPGIGLAASGTGDIPSFIAVGNAAGPVKATITVNPLNSTGCNGAPVTFTITINPKPVPGITATGSLASLTTVYGTPSAAESFVTSTANLTSAVVVSAPAGFEVSSDGVAYSNPVTIGGSGNASSIIYIRLAAAVPVGNYGGEVKLSSGNAVSTSIEMPDGNVTTAPLTITADNKSRLYGAVNPVLTATYAGFVNHDGPEQLTALPELSTTATSSSAPGQYAINIGNAGSPNYSFTYIPGILTVTASLSIPNTFTPNGDGINDTWTIRELQYYPKSAVTVFNRLGQKVFSSVGYAVPWDGTYDGKILPTGTYYYIIDLKDGGKAVAGWVTILR